MRKYHYSWMHIPSGRAGFDSILLPSEGDFHRVLRSWSRPGVWKYRAIKEA